MITSIEYLSTELWMDIFSYLEAHELLRAFRNLNSYFDRLIASEYLLFNACFGKSNRNPLVYSVQPYWPETILRRIISIRPVIQHQLSHIPEFLRWHSINLIQLKALTMKLRGREIGRIAAALQQLQSLDYLFIECVPNQQLLDSILALPVLRICRLELLRPITPITSHSNYSSNIKTLYLKIHDDSYGSIAHLLLIHMPKLTKLVYDNCDVFVKNREWLFFQPLFTLAELDTLRFRCTANYSTPSIFQNLHKNCPTLRRLNLEISFDFIDEDLLTNLMEHWWPVCREIERVKLLLRCRQYSIANADGIQANLGRFQAIWLGLNEQCDRSIKTVWTESFSIVSKLLEISLCKSS